MKKVRRGYAKGTTKYMVLFVLCLAALEALSLYFPMLLQNLTTMVEDGKSVTDLILYGLLILAFIIAIFVVQFLSEYMGAIYGDKYQSNVRKSLYEKFSRLSNDQIDQIGVGRILPIIMNDSNWLKTYSRRIVQFCVFFPVAILGSFIMLFNLSWAYALFAVASLPIVLVFFYLNVRRMSKFIPASVEGYDEYFLNIKEGIIGAKDIRILGKAEERSVDFEKHVKVQQRQWLATNRATNLSTGFNAILFTIITIAIIIFGAAANLTPYEMRGVVVLNTAVQYIDKIWKGSHTIFTWFAEYIPRVSFTKKRLEKFYEMPEQPMEGGLTVLPTYEKHSLKFQNVSFQFPNGKTELEDVSINIDDARAVAIAGGIGSGKSIIPQLLLQFKEPNSGHIVYNDIEISQVNSNFWRRNVMSFCSGSPSFIPGTIRDNMKLLNPEVTDEQILKAFKDIGAMDFVGKFENFLDFKINELSNLNDSTKNVLNLVRTILKPADIYVFNQCFEHIKHSYITKMMQKLKKEKKTSLYITYDGAVCKNCDHIYVLKNGHIKGTGTHSHLMKTNKYYNSLHTSGSGVMLYEETVVVTEGIEETPDVVQVAEVVATT